MTIMIYGCFTPQMMARPTMTNSIISENNNDVSGSYFSRLIKQNIHMTIVIYLSTKLIKQDIPEKYSLKCLTILITHQTSKATTSV